MLVNGPGTFLLGVGCQKGGTAWLHRYLEASPQVDPGFRKEYHVWDSLDLASGRLARERIEAQGGPRAQFLAEPDSYFDYFTGLLDRPGIRLTADITPGYAALPVSRLAMVRSGFEERGVRPVAAYLLRDPVERIWSHLRMQAQRFPTMFKQQPLPEVLLERHTDANYALRTRYDHTIAALDEAFDPDAVYYGFYEDLFTRERMEEICAFLGIDFVEPEFDVRRNASERPAETVPDDTVRAVATHFADVYDAVAARFPNRDLEALWPSARFAR